MNISFFCGYGCIVGLNANLWCKGDLNSKFLSVYFIVWNKCLSLTFKVNDQGYHMWMLFKFKVQVENVYNIL